MFFSFYQFKIYNIRIKPQPSKPEQRQELQVKMMLIDKQFYHHQKSFQQLYTSGRLQIIQNFDMFCCSPKEKQYDIEIFKQHTYNMLHWREKTQSKQHKTHQNYLTNKPNRLATKRNVYQIEDAQANQSILNKEGQRDKEIRIISNEWLTEVSPIDYTTITQSEIANFLLESQQFYEGIYGYCRMIKKSNYEQLIKELPTRKQPWVDKDFQKRQSYTVDKTTYRVNWVGLDIISKRVGDRVKIIEKFIQPKDIVQSSVIGDCYFMSALAALAQSPRRILRMFPNLFIETDVFMVKMMFKGILQEVVIDQYFPCEVDNQQLLGCRPCKDQRMIYPMILQKCWAKLWKSYAKIDGGYPHEALRALTGAPTKNYILWVEANGESKSKSFFQQILSYDKKMYVMCTGTNKKGSISIRHRQRGVISVGIQPGHIYTVEQLREQQGKRVIKIYNPWGHNLISGTNTRISGQFIIKWQEFVKQFSYLTVCKIKDQANYLYMELQGCKRDKLRFIELEVSSLTPITYSLTVSETDRKEDNKLQGNSYICVTFIVLRQHQGQRYEFIAMKSGNQYSDHYLEINNIQSGKLLIGLYFSEVDIKETLTFSVYSEGKFGFRQRKVDSYFQAHFFTQVLLSYNLQHPSSYKYPNFQNDKIKVTFQTTVQNTILGFYIIQVDKDSPQSFTARMCRNQFIQKGLKVLPPYDKQFIEVSAHPGHTTIMIIMTINHQKFLALDNRYYLNNHRHICDDMIFEQVLRQVK